MAKKIKFSLNIDNKQIRNLEDLRENFNINDIFELYNNKILHKWLEVRGYTKELEKLNSINKNDNSDNQNNENNLIICDFNDLSEIDDKTINLRNVIESLVEIFEIEATDNDIDSVIYSISFRELKKKELEIFRELEDNYSSVVDIYHKKYDILKNSIFSENKNIDIIKNLVSELSNNYFNLFKLNYKHFFNSLLIEDLLLPILIMLTNNKLRTILLNQEFNKDNYIYNCLFEKDTSESKLETINEYGEYYLNKEIIIKGLNIENPYYRLDIVTENNTFMNKEILELINKIIFVKKIYSNSDYNKLSYLEVVGSKSLNKNLLKYLKSFKGKTESYWKDLESKNKKVMVISVPEGTFIRSQGKSGEELPAKDVNGQFPILDGLDYKSNIDNEAIYYIEV